MLLTSSCSVLPERKIQQPWNRILAGNTNIPLGSVFNIETSGETNSLLGNESLTQDNIKNIATGLIERRGFEVNNSEYSYKMKILYSTNQIQKNLNYHSSTSMLNYNFAENTSYNKFGLGVSLANSIREANASSQNTVVNMNYDVISYIHTYSVEIYDKSSNLIWKAETYWNSQDLDIISQSQTKLQILFSNLPYNYSKPIHVKELKKQSKMMKTNTSIRNKVFNCPALPYMIYFDTQQQSSTLTIPIKNENERATMAFIDLLQTAEFCLPATQESKWENPTNPYIWTRIMLGGQYILGSSNEKINVLIDLVANVNGYTVKSCRIVSNAEYAEFQSKMDRWKSKLSDYYDFFVE